MGHHHPHHRAWVVGVRCAPPPPLALFVAYSLLFSFLDRVEARRMVGCISAWWVITLVRKWPISEVFFFAMRVFATDLVQRNLAPNQQLDDMTGSSTYATLLLGCFRGCRRIKVVANN